MRAERNYEGKRWVTYDCQFHRQALAKKDLNWSVTNPRLYNAFTGRARAIARCTLCLQDDHSAAYCPHNLHRPFFTWFPDPTFWPAFTPPNPPLHARPSTSQETCWRFNEGQTKQQYCKYCHACNACQGGPHILGLPIMGCNPNHRMEPLAPKSSSKRNAGSTGTEVVKSSNPPRITATMSV